MKNTHLLVVALAFVVAALGCGGGGGGVPRFTDKPVSIAQRTVALNTIAQKLDSFVGTSTTPAAQNDAIAALMRSLPEFEDAGVTADGCAWGRFTDGRLLTVANNREITPDRATSLPSLLSSPYRSRVVGSNLPVPIQARLCDTMGTSFRHPTDELRPLLVGHGYSIAGDTVLKGTVEDLKQVSGDGYFYMDAHGGSCQARDGSQVFSVWTGTKYDATQEDAYKTELNQSLLTYMVARGDGVAELHYAITPRFVRKYFHFGDNSLVFLNACSTDNLDFKQACLDRGAGLYLGWSNPVSDGSSYGAAVFMAYYLLGDPRDVPYPLLWNEAYSKMESTNFNLTHLPLTQSVSHGLFAHLEATFGSGSFGLTNPSLRDVVSDAATRTVVLKGFFGDTPGTVDGNGTLGVPGQSLTVQDWSATRIQVPYVTGIKNVIVRVDGRPSNSMAVPELDTCGARPNDISTPCATITGAPKDYPYGQSFTVTVTLSCAGNYRLDAFGTITAIDGHTVPNDGRKFFLAQFAGDGPKQHTVTVQAKPAPLPCYVSVGAFDDDHPQNQAVAFIKR